MRSSKPDFLIIGAQKCGTTSLADTLRKHSQIFICEPREPEYFSRAVNSMGSRDEEWARYVALFKNAPADSLRGEASTGTMFHPDVIPIIKKRIPNAKFLVLLRKPEARAYSGFAHCVKMGRVKVEGSEDIFAREVEDYLSGKDGRFDWFARSEYSRQLEPFIDCFGERLKVVIFEELVSDTSRILKEVQEFLGVPIQPLHLERENVTQVPRGPISEAIVFGIRKFIGQGLRDVLGEKRCRSLRARIMNFLGRRPQGIDPAIEARLRKERFSTEIESLERLLDRKLDCWVTNSSLRAVKDSEV